MIKTKRVYDRSEPGDGVRVLVDRLWPRGLSKDAAKVDQWLKDIAPSDALRRWYGHDSARWEQFKRRYEAELGHKREQLAQIKRAEKENGAVTLLYASRDTTHNNASVLLQYLECSGR